MSWYYTRVSPESTESASSGRLADWHWDCCQLATRCLVLVSLAIILPAVGSGQPSARNNSVVAEQRPSIPASNKLSNTSYWLCFVCDCPAVTHLYNPLHVLHFMHCILSPELCNVSLHNCLLLHSSFWGRPRFEIMPYVWLPSRICLWNGMYHILLRLVK